MPTLSSVSQPDARSYRRMHAGKLMIVQRKEGTPPKVADFFYVADVGTHPTGLMVTGLFSNERRSHMMASTVREASAAEIEWRASSQGERSCLIN